MRRASVVLLLIGAVAGGTAYFAKHTPANPGTKFHTAAVQRGDLLSTIAATGTVEPEEVVDVGAQVAGLIVGIWRRSTRSGQVDRLRFRRREGHGVGPHRPHSL